MRLKLWTGPCDVDQWALRCRKASLTVACKGTEHVYIDVPDSREGTGATVHNAAADADLAGDHVLARVIACASIV